MSTIIEFIITFVLYFLVCLAAMLPIAIFHTRKMDKLIDNFFHEVNESCAARLQSLKEVHAQVDELAKPADETDKSADEIHESFDEIHKDIGEIHEDMDEIHESFDEIHKDIGEMSESLDRMNESMDRTIEFKRIISEYLDNKIKRIEARENFCESQFWDEKNIH